MGWMSEAKSILQTEHHHNIKSELNNNYETRDTLQESNREEAFNLWMTSPMPMVTLTKTFDITRILKVCKKSGCKPNTLLCWCIGKTASRTKEFYTLPENGKLFKYYSLAINRL